MLYRFLLLSFVCTFFSCGFTQKIKTGSDAFAVKQYSVAARMLEDEYNLTEDPEEKGRHAFLIGQSYEFMRQPELAAPWYRRAADHNFGITALERYADALRQSERYPEAIEVYKELMESGTEAQKYRGLITLCNQAMQWQAEKNASPYQIESADFNSPGADYSPYVLGPEIVLFTSDRKNPSGGATYQWTGRNYSDLYTANLNTGLVQPFDHIVNSAENEGTITFTASRNEMYFTRCYAEGEIDSYCKLMMCQLRGASWTEPQPLPFTQQGVNYGHPVLTRNDSILIFSSNDPKGAGGYDLYYSLRSPAGWQTPVSLGERINTTGNERFPSMHMDTLYFSSDQLPGLGGYDIFKTYLDAKGNWTPPLNLKPPVNSGWDDFGFVVDTFSARPTNVTEQGYFTSSRNSKTSDDIFFYQKVRPVEKEKETIVVTPPVSAAKQQRVYLAIHTKEPIFAEPGNPNSARIGKKDLPNTPINVGEGPMMNRAKTSSDGTLILELSLNKEYNFLAQKAGYLNQYRALSTKNVPFEPGNPIYTFNMEIVMEPIFEDREIVMQDIFYDYDEWFIREDAKPALDNLTKMLKDNPQLRIQLSSHTDCRGENDYNQDLSQKRAQSAVDYLVSQGIPVARIVPVGYGESRLDVQCPCETCSEDEHQKNRRTTFKILPRE